MQFLQASIRSHRRLQSPRTNTSFQRTKCSHAKLCRCQHYVKGHSSSSQFSPPAAARTAIPPPHVTLTTFGCPRTCSALTAAAYSSFPFCTSLVMLPSCLLPGRVNHSLQRLILAGIAPPDGELPNCVLPQVLGRGTLLAELLCTSTKSSLSV